MRKIIALWDNTSLHLTRFFYFAGLGAAALFVLSYFTEVLFDVALAVIIFTFLAALADVFFLYRKKGLQAERLLKDRLSNGDENPLVLEIRNNYGFSVRCTVVEELPFQLQDRNWKKRLKLLPQEMQRIHYSIRPVERGEYHFGFTNLYAGGPLGLVRRRFRSGEEKTVKVYPSYVQMKRFQLKAVGAHLQQTGVKRIRRLGHSMEFEQIKEYVVGDDYRTINWKATARKGDFMVNNYTDERSQQIYCIINKGRVMKMPFEGLTLLDHAINASLVLSNVALQKQDKAGLICFSQNMDAFIAADKKPTQINLILEALYKQKTAFLEADMEKLFSVVRNRITHRSLLVFFTNYESIESLERDLPSLKRLAHYHLLMVVFFENTELKSLTESRVATIEDIYIKTIAEKFRYEKQLIAKELQKHGIIALLTPPEKLTINALNKYLEIKNRSSI